MNVSPPSLPLSRKVEKFCRSLSALKPVWLDFTDVGAGYKAGNCHTNTLHKVRQHGGTRVFGWTVWEHPERFPVPDFIEAEHHSVWRPANSTDLVDLTPRVSGEPKVLFVPDPKRPVGRSDLAHSLGWANRTTLQKPFNFLSSSQPSSERIHIKYDPSFIAELAAMGMTPTDV